MQPRLIRGNCVTVMRKLAADGVHVDHMIFDPPYEESMHRAKSATHRGRGIRTDGQRDLETLKFASIKGLRTPTVKAARALCRGWFMAFCTPEGVAAWRDAVEASGGRYKRACVWDKIDAAPQFNGQGPGMGAEMIVAAWYGKGVSRWNGGGRRGVFSHPCNPQSRLRGKDGTALHPTEKPFSLMCELIELFTNPGDTVLDPFMGIGSTGAACVRLGRNFIGIEKDPGYFAIAEKRLAEQERQPDIFTGTFKLKNQGLGLEGGAVRAKPAKLLA